MAFETIPGLAAAEREEREAPIKEMVELRLACLTLAIGPTRSVQDSIRLAAGFEAWCIGGDKAAVNAAMDRFTPAAAEGADVR